MARGIAYLQGFGRRPAWVIAEVVIVVLFLFDLGTLDGIFRVAVFIVGGLILLGMSTGYARSLAQQERSQQW